MIDSSVLNQIKNRCGFSNGLCLSSVGNSGGMGFWWKDINANVVSYSDHHFEVNLLDDNNTPRWRAIGIYGGGVPRSERLMDAFREDIDQCRLRDLGFKGSIFTWEIGNSMTIYVRDWLDRFLADDGWMALFPDYEVQNFPNYSSDHAPIMVSLKKRNDPGMRGKSFRFEPLWLSREDCGEIVDESWNASLELNIDRKIARRGEDLSLWARKSCGSIKKIKDIKKKLRELKEAVMDGSTLELCKNMSVQLDTLHMQEEYFLFARA
ncbi:uncharacterized protein LOC110735805 [Chenopodium quinoa]|uniref:uncharacterized protein LOC110735805 n=1 Tax=Chenopodium quinoa TaxID=63459 RepID=UPI000B771BB0|nr:uncharacterized protein LOC110735805 [Chenopodium quinoa]